jgi:hypothetical protein
MILSGAVILTWLYNRSGGSVLIAILFHWAFNFAGSQAIGLGLIPLERYFTLAPVAYALAAAVVALLWSQSPHAAPVTAASSPTPA